MTTTGERIREARRMRQFSAAQLAARVHITADYLLKIERGIRTPSQGVLTDLARVLRVNAEWLNGQPFYGAAEGQDRVQAVIPELRRIMLTYDSPDFDAAPRSLEDLTIEVERVSSLRRDARFTAMGPILPSLITELTTVALGAPQLSRERAAAFGQLAMAYRAANSLAHKLGHHDLSNTALERLRWAADQSWDPLLRFTGGYLVAGAMLRQGAYKPARHLLVGLREELERLQPEQSFTQAASAVDGALVLKLAMLEARAGHVEAAEERLNEASWIADRLGRDMVVRETTFGPSQVKIHEVAMRLEIGDTSQALALPTQWGRAEGREEWAPPAGLAAERSSHHYIDYSSVQLAEGQRHGALVSLLKARQLAPQHTRFHPRARDTVGTLLRLEAHPSEELSALGRWISA